MRNVFQFWSLEDTPGTQNGTGDSRVALIMHLFRRLKWKRRSASVNPYYSRHRNNMLASDVTIELLNHFLHSFWFL